MSNPARSSPTSDWFGQPRGLTILFLTEMWEVFCNYGMRALLIYYMISELEIDRVHASLIYGFYSGFTYLTPILGGFIADRYLGRTRAVILGASIMAIGQIMLTNHSLFYPSLVTIVFGVGFFLPSLPSQIQDLYADDDPRRQSAYSVYYIGKNLGALLATLICGAIGETFGWRWGFLAGAAGMLIGLGVYVGGRHWLPVKRIAPDAFKSAEHTTSGVAPAATMLIIVGLAVVLFRAAYEQTGNALAIWLDRGVDRSIGTWTIPMTWFQSLNPAFIFILSPLLILFWRKRATRGVSLSPLAKMAAGSLMLGIAFILLALFTYQSTAQEQATHWLAVVLFILILTVAELYVLPIGLGVFGRLAPPHLAATVIALWYTTSFGGNVLGGFVGAASARLTPTTFFLAASALPLIAGVTIALCARHARLKDYHL